MLRPQPKSCVWTHRLFLSTCFCFEWWSLLVLYEPKLGFSWKLGDEIRLKMRASFLRKWKRPVVFKPSLFYFGTHFGEIIYSLFHVESLIFLRCVLWWVSIESMSYPDLVALGVCHCKISVFFSEVTNSFQLKSF